MKIITFIFCILLALPIGYIALLLSKSPDVSNIRGCFTTSMYQIKLCPSSNTYTSISEISELLIKAIIVSEDASFYIHDGFDFFELKQSFFSNWRNMKFRRGGSTISQQLVKNLYLQTEKSLSRKIIEAYLTFKIERSLSKNEIMEKYLNVIEFGPHIYGVKQASSNFFQKKPKDLNLLESVFLAHVLPNPKVLSERSVDNLLSKKSVERMTLILNRLLKYEKITEDQHIESISRLEHRHIN